MKVLLLTTDAYGANGGIALYNRDVVEALAGMPEIEHVTVLARNMPWVPVGVPAGATLVNATVGGKLRFIKAAFKAAREHFDLVICGHINLLPLAAALNLKVRAPLVLMVYGIDVWQPPTRLAAQWLRAVDAVWTISAITRERMNAWSRLPEARYVLLPNAIHLDRYGRRPRRPELVARHGLEGSRVLMTLARLPENERYKGVDEVMEVMPSLLREVPTLKYLVAGDGDDRPRLMKKAVELGLGDRVIFTGMLNEDDKADYFRLADAFVMPGRGEGFGFVFLEALACGVPVVGSCLDGSREALRGGELGDLADPRDPLSVRQCILNALSKPAGIPQGLAWFDWPHFQNRLAAAVRHLMARQPGAR